MNGYLISKKKDECFGCGACYQACTANAIRMVIDAEGFFYPEIDMNKCIGCNRCHRVCPTEKQIEFSMPLHTFAGYHKDNNIRTNSSSGGAFKAILEAVNENSMVFGAKWENKTLAVHSLLPVAKAYVQFSKSKYVQSNIQDSYKKCESLLKDNIFVVFSGTPCQIAGLKCFLQKEYSNLLCVDLVCHGVPNSELLAKYLECVEREKSDTIYKIDFRYKKRRFGTWESKLAALYGEKRTYFVDYESSSYLRGYANGLFFRPSCMKCPFASGKRISDITIGDAWGIDKHYAEMFPHEGISLVLVNTEKGDALTDRMKALMELREVQYQILTSGNARLRNPDSGHKRRNEFFELLSCGIPFDEAVKIIIPTTPKWKIIGHQIKELLKK